MTDGMLRQALAYASRGWPVFPCQPGQKTPATWHGYRDATTDPDRIAAWFSLLPRWNLAIATGKPGPDVLDVDQHGPAGNGFAALERLSRAGLLEGASACVRTPRGGLHIYFAGSGQHNGHLARQHVDFRSAGGYILAELWSVLYLQDQRSAGLLSAQAEYQARILPALSGQFMTETTGCGHASRPGNVRPRSAS